MPVQHQWDDTDFYEVLGVDRDATLEEIKIEYRKLVKKYHPDVSKNKDDVDKFREVQKAYEVLSDPDMRKFYDENGFVGGNPTPIDEEARNVVRGWVVHMIDDFMIGDEMQFDCKKKIKDIAKDLKKNVEAQKFNLEKRINRAEKFYNRMVTQEYKLLIKQQLNTMKMQKADLLRGLQVVEKIFEIAKELEYDGSDMSGEEILAKLFITTG